VFETTVAVLFLIPKTARLGAKLVVLWMTVIILSHIFVLGYGRVFVDASRVDAAGCQLSHAYTQGISGTRSKEFGDVAAVQTQKHSRAKG